MHNEHKYASLSTGVHHEHKSAQWTQICVVSINVHYELNVQLAGTMCTCAQMQRSGNLGASTQHDDLSLRFWGLHKHKHISTQVKSFSVWCAEVQWGWNLGSTLCFSLQCNRPQNQKAFNFLFCLLPRQSRREKYPQVVARVSHQKSPRRFMGRGWRWRREGKVDAKSFLTRIKSTTQSASLNDLSAVPSPLCPHDSTPGEVAKVKLINSVTTFRSFTWPCLTIMPSVWDSWLLCWRTTIESCPSWKDEIEF